MSNDTAHTQRYPRLEVLSVALIFSGFGTSFAALDAGLRVLSVMGVVLGLLGVLIVVAVNPPEAQA